MPSTAAPLRWDALNDPGNLGRVEAVEISPFDSRTIVAGGDVLGAGVTRDGGATWTKINRVLPSTKAWSIALHPKDPKTLWVALGAGGGVYKSTDGGASWRSSSAGMSDLTDATVYRTIAVAKSNPDYLYCGAWEGSRSTYRSTDGGNTWSRIVSRGSLDSLVGGTANSGILVFQRIAIDPNDPKHVVGACEGRVVQSFDAGDTWKDVTCVAAGDGWRGNGYSGMCGSRIAWNPYKPGQVFTLGCDEGKLERSENSLWSWKLKGSPGLIGPYNGSADVAFAPDGTIYIGSGQFGNKYGRYANEPIIKSSDWGATWAYVKRPPGAVGDNRAVYVNPKDSRQVWCLTGASSSGTLWRSDDGGMSWRALDLQDAGSLWNIAADPNQPTTMYVGARNGIYQTTDGEYFSRIPGSPTSGNFEYAYLDPTNSKTLYAISFNSGSKGGLYRYDGAVWTRLLVKPQARAVAVDPANPKRIAVCTRGWTAFDETSADGVWISPDGGATWSLQNDGLRMLSGPAIAFNPDKSSQLLLATDGAGFYATDAGDSTPHGTKARNILDAIRATDYDDGLQGFNIQPGDRGEVLRGLKSGQWVKYRVLVPETGYYDIACNAISPHDSKFHLEFNGVNVTGPVEIKPVAKREKMLAVRVPNVSLVAGEQYLKLAVESDSLDLESIQAVRHP